MTDPNRELQGIVAEGQKLRQQFPTGRGYGTLILYELAKAFPLTFTGILGAPLLLLLMEAGLWAAKYLFGLDEGYGRGAAVIALFSIGGYLGYEIVARTLESLKGLSWCARGILAFGVYSVVATIFRGVGTDTLGKFCFAFVVSALFEVLRRIPQTARTRRFVSIPLVIVVNRLGSKASWALWLALTFYIGFNSSLLNWAQPRIASWNPFPSALSAVQETFQTGGGMNVKLFRDRAAGWVAVKWPPTDQSPLVRTKQGYQLNLNGQLLNFEVDESTSINAGAGNAVVGIFIPNHAQTNEKIKPFCSSHFSVDCGAVYEFLQDETTDGKLAMTQPGLIDR